MADRARDSQGRFVSGGGSSGRVVWVSDTLTPRLHTSIPKFHTALQAIVEYESNDAQNYMRQNAPWTDRTANARQGLFARAFHTGTKHVIVLYGTVPYQIWLEVKHSGKYAIIGPSLPVVGKNVMNQVQNVLGKMAA